MVLKYQGKEHEEELGLNTYDFSARNYMPDLGHWTTLDEHTASTGLSTHVKLNDDGEWEVVKSGDPDNDEDGNAVNTGLSIGESLTSHSFFDGDNNAVVGAIIDLGSTKGQDFIDDEIIRDHPFIGNYMVNATGGEHHDFKDRGIKEGKTNKQHRYRGSVASNGKIGLARDFGNEGAGIVAGRFGLSWRAARLGFDALETRQHSSVFAISLSGSGTSYFFNINLTSEKTLTQKAQRLG
ncbi:hypothetical protein ACG2LH_16655 [Zhouia sp. PK063]|uniref:hypothetical protein n=1 Tax=Zhouia sp. PK063 TaxID=3373602 RepID=UPI0037ADBE1D